MPANLAGDKISHCAKDNMKEANTGIKVKVRNPNMFGAKKAAPERILEIVVFLFPRRTALENWYDAMGRYSVCKF